MRVINLLPSRVRFRHQRRRWVRRWVGSLTLFAVVGACASFTGHAAADRDDRDAVRALAVLTRERIALHSRVSALRSDVLTLFNRVRANREIGEQPDWSVLLRFLAKQGRGEVVITQLGLRSQDPDDTKQTAESDGSTTPISLRMEGYGLSPTAVSGFVLRLENSGLFEQVTIERTDERPFLSRKATFFGVTATMGK